VTAYAAYLRIYEPVSAFHEPDRSRWAAYAGSPTRPRRRDSLAVEHAEALRRAITTPYAVVPEQESGYAYIRSADGITYVCPWQTRLHILASTWTVPLIWFVPFAPAERWLSLGEGRGRAVGPATASATRALVYTTPMSRARRRVARGLAALRHLTAGSGDAPLEPDRAIGELAGICRWLEDFHPYSIVELDYGGLVHLVSDDALCGDQSVAEIRAAIDGAARGECELAAAGYLRARDRRRAFAEFEQAN
jgi:hypothetical protein